MYNKVYCSAALGLSSSHFLMQFKSQDMGRVFTCIMLYYLETWLGRDTSSWGIHSGSDSLSCWTSTNWTLNLSHRFTSQINRTVDKHWIQDLDGIASVRSSLNLLLTSTTDRMLIRMCSTVMVPATQYYWSVQKNIRNHCWPVPGLCSVCELEGYCGCWGG